MIKHPPRPAQILMCDFHGFKEPEMTKNRPVIVLSGALEGRYGLANVVALSTVSPDSKQSYHCTLPKASLPMRKGFQEKETWVKGDMIYTVSHARLNLILLRRDNNGKRIYFTNRLGRDKMGEVYKCVLHGLNLGKLEQFI